MEARSMSSPTLAIFDVNETLSDLEPFRARFGQVGAPPQLLAAWFASTLRDGFALTAAGGYADFRTIAKAVLRGQLGQLENPEQAAEHVLAGFDELDVHPDVAEGMRKLADAGVRMVTLTNGAAEIGAKLLERAGLAELVERTISVDEVRRWKPAPQPYLHATRACGLPPEECVLIAAHPWDVDGAKRAGLKAGWLNRKPADYPNFFERPDVSGDTLGGLVDALLAG
jgi:2-haloacid dehalogenase